MLYTQILFCSREYKSILMSLNHFEIVYLMNSLFLTNCNMFMVVIIFPTVKLTDKSYNCP